MTQSTQLLNDAEGKGGFVIPERLYPHMKILETSKGYIAAFQDATMEITDPAAHIQSFWANGHWYEQEMLEYIAINYSGGTFIDVGASIGNHTVYFGMHCKPDARIAFEPVKESFDHMYRNVILNGSSVVDLINARLYNLAIGTKSCRGEMVMPDGGNEGMETFMKSLTGTVNMFPLDRFEIQNVTLIKIDAEGCELAILHGAMETINRERPAIFIEARTAIDLHNILEVLSPMGYEPRNQFNETPTYELTC